MHKLFWSLILFAGVLHLAPADDGQKPEPPDVEFPQASVVPQPMPAGAVPVVEVDEWYVVTQNKPGFFLVEPAELAATTTLKGPVTLKGKFAGGGGRVQTKHYTNPSILVVETNGGTGRATITFVPEGSKDGSNVKRQVVQLNGSKPPPVPPTPPDPKPPEPKPPEPTTFNPFAADGFRVLIVYPAEGIQGLPQSQRLIFDNADIRQYTNTHCVRGADGKTPEFRQYPEGADLTNEFSSFRLAYGRQRTSLPWVVMSNGKTGFEGPLPLSVQDTKTLFTKYGGP